MFIQKDISNLSDRFITLIIINDEDAQGAIGLGNTKIRIFAFKTGV